MPNLNSSFLMILPLAFIPHQSLNKNRSLWIFGPIIKSTDTYYYTTLIGITLTVYKHRIVCICTSTILQRHFSVKIIIAFYRHKKPILRKKNHHFLV